jgi:hypothetical protein
MLGKGQHEHAYTAVCLMYLGQHEHAYTAVCLMYLGRTLVGFTGWSDVSTA